MATMSCGVVGDALPELEAADVFNLIATVDGTVVVCGAMCPPAKGADGARISIAQSVYLPPPTTTQPDGGGGGAAAAAAPGTTTTFASELEVLALDVLQQIAPELLRPPLPSAGLTGGYSRKTSQTVVVVCDSPTHAPLSLKLEAANGDGGVVIVGDNGQDGETIKWAVAVANAIANGKGKARLLQIRGGMAAFQAQFPFLTVPVVGLRAGADADADDAPHPSQSIVFGKFRFCHRANSVSGMGSGYPSAVASANADNSLAALPLQAGEKDSVMALANSAAAAAAAAAGTRTAHKETGAAGAAAETVAAAAAASATPPDPAVVYLGNLRHCCSDFVMRDLKIKYIVDAGFEGDDMFETRDSFKRQFDIEYHIIEVPDVSEADITPYFVPASHFIDTALAGQRKGGVGSVLVHCRAGVSRSTSLVLHWMMARKTPDWTARVNLGSAFTTVKGRRSIVGPNTGFRRQLLAAELAIFGRNSVGISLIPEDSRASGSSGGGGGGARGGGGGGGGGGGASLSKWKKKQNKKDKGGCTVC